MSVRTAWKLVVLIVIAIVLYFGFQHLGIWSVRRTFEETKFDGLHNILESAGGKIVVTGSMAPLSPNRSGDGVIGFYQRHPQELQEDRKYLQTWWKALAIVDRASAFGESFGWRSTESLDWIPTAQRQDAWGRSFCVRSDQRIIVVVSAGPTALSPFECGQLILSPDAVKVLPKGRLNLHPSGALILVVTPHQ